MGWCLKVYELFELTLGRKNAFKRLFTYTSPTNNKMLNQQQIISQLC